MFWTNFHTHSKYCDGEGELRDYVKEALKRNVSILGFSGHAPLPYPTDWLMKKEDLDAYFSEIQKLKKEYSGKIKIYAGLEIDYIFGEETFNRTEFKNHELDYAIGAVHFNGFLDSHTPWAIDGSPESFERGYRKIYNKDIRKLVKNYYHNVRNMISEKEPDIVAHLDLIKKNNRNERYFSVKEDWYRDEVIKTIRILKKSRSILEINTGGIIREKTDFFYPDEWIIKICFENNIPITINSDAHKPEQITGEFERAAEILLNTGYRKIRILGQNGWQSCSFSKSGIINNSSK